MNDHFFNYLVQVTQNRAGNEEDVGTYNGVVLLDARQGIGGRRMKGNSKILGE